MFLILQLLSSLTSNCTFQIPGYGLLESFCLDIFTVQTPLITEPLGARHIWSTVVLKSRTDPL